jgi:hypothetical protein
MRKITYVDVLNESLYEKVQSNILTYSSSVKTKILMVEYGMRLPVLWLIRICLLMVAMQLCRRKSNV